MNPVLARIFETGMVVTETGEEIPLKSGIGLEDGLLLHKLVREYRPRISLEVGCAYGVSSLFICEAMREIGGEEHIIIDPNQSTHWRNVGRANLKRANLDDIVRFYEEPSHRCLPRLEAEGRKVDFAFIDGMHTFDYVFADLFLTDKVLNVGGIIVLDDMPWPSVRKAARYVLTNLPYEVVGKVPPLTVKDKMRPFLPFASRLRPEITQGDTALGIGWGRFLAIRKLAEDNIGEEPGSTRHWTTHHPF
jgi:predicted O-methyltransferase YrrM